MNEVDGSGRSRAVVITQVALAAVLLAIIGGSAGLVLGLRSGGGPGQEPLRQGMDAGASATSPSGGPSPGAPRCLAHTEELARKAGAVGQLTQVFYLRTVVAGGGPGSEVWICADADGTLFYQGHKGSPQDRPLNEGDNALFLTTVERSGDGYIAINGDTQYLVLKDRLVIKGPDGQEVQYAAQ